MRRLITLRRRVFCLLTLMWILTSIYAYIFLFDDYGKLDNRFIEKQLNGEKGLPSGYSSKPENQGEIFSLNQKKSRVLDFCNIPNKGETGDEGKGPEEYILKAVYTIIRHGDRTTLYSFPKKSNPAISCQINQSSHPKLQPFIDTMKQYKGQQERGSQFQSWALYPNKHVCDNSFLTPSGTLQHLLNGLHLKEQYEKKLEMFTGKFSPDKLNIKVTEYSRTYQSAIALLYGFLPHFNLTQLNIQLSHGLLFCSPRIVGASCTCPAIQYYKTRSVQEVAKSPHYQQQKIKNIQKKIAHVFGIETNQLPFNSAIFDILSSFMCHKIPLPCNSNGECITEDILEDLASYLENHGSLLEKSPTFQKYSVLSSYSLLMDIAHHMIGVAHDKTKEQFTLFSGHDKTVAPLLTTLGVNSGKSIRYATRVVFELYKHQDAKDHYFIKILHDGQDVTSKVKFCVDKTKNGLCKIKYFIEFINDMLKEVGLKTFSTACKVVRK